MFVVIIQDLNFIKLSNFPFFQIKLEDLTNELELGSEFYQPDIKAAINQVKFEFSTQN